jgi:hypothetical protein
LASTLSSDLPATLYGKIEVRIDAAREELAELRAKAAKWDQVNCRKLSPTVPWSDVTC